MHLAQARGEDARLRFDAERFRRRPGEAPALGVPLLVLLEKTERPEALWSGNMQLVGTDARQIIETVRKLLGDPVALAAMARPCLPYGDGRAGPRIAALIEQWLADRSPTNASRRRSS